MPTKGIQALLGGPGAPQTAFHAGTGAALSSGAIIGENQAVRRLECPKVCATGNNLYRSRATLCVPTKAIQTLVGGPGAPQTAFNAWTGAALSSGAIIGENQAVRRLECPKVCATGNNLYRSRATLCVPTKAIQALLGGPGAPQTAFNAWTGAALSSGAIIGENELGAK